MKKLKVEKVDESSMRGRIEKTEIFSMTHVSETPAEDAQNSFFQLSVQCSILMTLCDAIADLEVVPTSRQDEEPFDIWVC